MKLILNEDQVLADIDLEVDSAANTCTPKLESLGYRISGPETKMALVKDDSTDSLRLTLELPGITQAALVVEKSDIRKMKGLMNKDAIKFMVKALM